MVAPSLFRTSLLFLIVALLTFTSSPGCGPNYKARAKVKGKVKFFDKYLTCGTVAFTTEDGRQGAGNIDFDGNYEVGDAPIGDTVITVVVPNPPKAGPKGSPGGVAPPKDLPPMRPPGAVGGGGNVPTFDASKIVSIPDKYSKRESSGLKFRVESGDNTHNITLSP